MTLEQQIRSLARNMYWQEIYNSSQKCNGIKLFKNNYNFSGIQYLFLYWIRLYNMLYDELYSLEWRNLDKDVINDNARCDAFLYWRRKEQEKKIRENQKNEKKNNPKKANMIPVFTGARNKSKEGNK